MTKIYLPNWTQRTDCAGGVETFFGKLKEILPNAELISAETMSNKNDNFLDKIKNVDQYLLDEYKKDKNMLVIRDAEFCGFLDISKIKQIAFFQNPYKTINKIVGNVNHSWVIKDFLKNFKADKLIAASNFMADEMKLDNFKVDKVIPHGIDLDLFKPKNKIKLREKYKIPNKRVAVWVGDSNIVKNFQMILNLIDTQDIFWILISKNNFMKPSPNCKVFSNQTSEQVSELLNCADFFVLTSPVEGCCIAMLEAMACNLPCIISKAGYFWDFWDDRIGIQVNWNNFDEHNYAINKINQIKTDSRNVLIEKKLDYSTWKDSWKSIVEEVTNGQNRI